MRSSSAQRIKKPATARCYCAARIADLWEHTRMIPHACADDRRGCRCAGWISAGAIMDYAQRIRDLAARKLKIDAVIEQPPDPAMGDYALPCFAFAKAARKSPGQLAQEVGGERG